MNEEIQLLREIRDILLITAEPAIAKRDEKLRGALRTIVGRSVPKAKSVSLMDGSRSQAELKNEAGIDAGALSRCVKELREADLIGKDPKANPKLAITIPPNFFEAQ